MATLHFSENQNVEYKERWRDDYLKWVCGFANASGGYIYIGVKDDSHEIVGVENSKRLLEDIPNKIVTNLGIVADVNLRQAEGFDYIEIFVKPSNIPISYNGEYHYRSGSTKQELKGPAIQMRVYNDRVELWNDGNLPEGYTEEVLYNSHPSIPRNPKIANVMFKAGFIDTWGRGYKKIYNSFKNKDLPIPSVRNYLNGVQITIERTVFQGINQNVVKDVVKDVVNDVVNNSDEKIKERYISIIKIIMSNPLVAAVHLSEKLSVSQRTIQRDLAKLQEMGLLIREGERNGGRWVITNAIN